MISLFVSLFYFQACGSDGPPVKQENDVDGLLVLVADEGEDFGVAHADLRAADLVVQAAHLAVERVDRAFPEWFGSPVAGGAHVT